jgi:hypothetical protein
MGRIKMNRPIILDNVVVRSGGNDKTFEYDYSKDMNVVKKGDFSIPFIDFGSNAVELETKTKVRSESDDEAFNNILELTTKTEVKRERDDEGLSLLELESKTFVERERDDEDGIGYN